MVDLMTVKNAALLAISALLIAGMICCISTAVVVVADDALPRPTEAIQSPLPDAMRRNCREASNGCQVCVILPPSDIIHCSLPGIACQPRTWLCRVPVGKQGDGVRSDK